MMCFVSDMLEYGCTRLEIGVQSVYEDVARDTNRCLFVLGAMKGASLLLWDLIGAVLLLGTLTDAFCCILIPRHH